MSYDPFDFLSFVNRRANLVHVYTHMEIMLHEYKGVKDTTESQDRIDILKEHYQFLYELEKAYNAIERVNLDYLNNNLMLISRIKELEKELLTYQEL